MHCYLKKTELAKVGECTFELSEPTEYHLGRPHDLMGYWWNRRRKQKYIQKSIEKYYLYTIQQGVVDEGNLFFGLQDPPKFNHLII